MKIEIEVEPKSFFVQKVSKEWAAQVTFDGNRNDGRGYTHTEEFCGTIEECTNFVKKYFPV